MVDSWERQTGALRPMTPPGGADQQEELNQHPPSGGRKGKKGQCRHLYLCVASCINEINVVHAVSALVALCRRSTMK